MIAPRSSKSTETNKSQVAAAYAIFLLGALVVYHWVANGEFTAVLTLSAVCQCCAFSLLGMQALSADGLGGISQKSLMLDAMAIAFRLSSTIQFDGYLPADVTGDYLYQMFDLVSLAMVCGVVYVKMQKNCNGDEEDDLPCVSLAAGAFVLAILLRGNLDDNAIFDTLWMWGTLVSAVAAIPQLQLMTRNYGCVPALTSHFVAVLGLGRCLSSVYMWHAFEDIECDPWITNFNHAGYAVLLAHVLHLLLLVDFAYYYCKNITTSGLQSPLPKSWVV
jgi:hypothetical protein